MFTEHQVLHAGAAARRYSHAHLEIVWQSSGEQVTHSFLLHFRFRYYNLHTASAPAARQKSDSGDDDPLVESLVAYVECARADADTRYKKNAAKVVQLLVFLLNRMQREGILSLSRQEIVVLDLNALERVTYE